MTLLNNQYQVLERLGGGGFSTTFLVEDTHMPSRRRCVLKQLKPVSVDPSIQTLIQERFQREAATLETLGELSHQIPRLYAYFTETQQYYLVQELIKGRTLTEIVQSQGVFSEATVLKIVLNLLPVIEIIHRQGIIHRDIKPDNIILRAQDDQPVLIDFGAVKETLSTVIDPQGQSPRSIVIGTPGFMAEEQSRGFPTYGSDLYSLGLTAIYLLTGKFPDELNPDPQTSQLLWHQWVPQVSPGLAVVLDRSIRLAARDRYPTVPDFLQALRESGIQNTHQASSLQPLSTSLPLEVNPSEVPSTQMATNVAIDQAAGFTLPKVGILSAIALSIAAISFVTLQQFWPRLEQVAAGRLQPEPTPIEGGTPNLGSRSTPTPKFAAIAYSVSTGDYGYGWNHDTQKEAEEQAIQDCNQQVSAQDCQPLNWFKNACGALARSSTGAYGYAWNQRIKIAESEAMAACTSYGGTECQVLLRLCSDRGIQ